MNRKLKKPLLSITVNRKDERDFERAERFCDWLSERSYYYTKYTLWAFPEDVIPD